MVTFVTIRQRHPEINTVGKQEFLNDVYAPRCCGVGSGLESEAFVPPFADGWCSKFRVDFLI